MSGYKGEFQLFTGFWENISLKNGMDQYFHCKRCYKVFELRPEIDRHIKMSHAKKLAFIVAKNNMQKALGMDEQQRIFVQNSCGYCHKTFIKKGRFCRTSLIHHVLKVHTKPSWKRFVCNLCSDKKVLDENPPATEPHAFTTRKLATEHIRSYHLTDRNESTNGNVFIEQNITCLPLMPPGFILDPVPQEMFIVN